MSLRTFSFYLLAALALLGAAPAHAQEARPAPLKVILDTDIGDDIDDAYALALLASRPNVRLLGVTTAFGQTRERAQIAAKLLQVMGRKDVSVYAGRRGDAKIGAQYAWARGFQSRSIHEEGAAEFMARQVARAPGEVTLVSIGALTNVGDLLTRFPNAKGQIKQIVIMGGAIHAGYDGRATVEPEWNIRCDPAAAQTVFRSGVPIIMAGLESTAMMKFDAPLQKRLFGYGTPATDALAALTALWGGTPILYDTVAVARALGEQFADEEPLNVEVDANGLTRAVPGTPNATLLVRPRTDAFLEWFVAALDPAIASVGSR
jgi:purine nucleosidase